MKMTAKVVPEDSHVVVIQRNPTSGTGRGRRGLLNFIRRLREAGFTVRSFADRDQLDRWIRNLPDPSQIRCLVAAGGDGTLASLAQRHSEFPIALLPMGTENLFARHVRVGRNGIDAAEAVIAGRTALFDTALVNDQRCLIMVSAGVDADVVRRLAAERTGNISHASYLRPVLASFFGYPYPSLVVRDRDGKIVASGSHVIAANLPEYGFRMPLTPLATPHDGLLDVCVFSSAGFLRTAWHALKMRLGFSVERHIVRSRMPELSIESEHQAVPVQFDGDPCEFCPVTVRIDPASLTLIVPDSFPAQTIAAS